MILIWPTFSWTAVCAVGPRYYLTTPASSRSCTPWFPVLILGEGPVPRAGLMFLPVKDEWEDAGVPVTSSGSCLLTLASFCVRMMRIIYSLCHFLTGYGLVWPRLQ